MTVNATSGLMNWTPSKAGEVMVLLSVRDGNGGEVWQEFAINVSGAVGPKASIVSPAALSVLEGKIMVQGKTARGTREVQRVEVRLDGGGWRNATGTSNWTFDLDTAGLQKGRHTIYARAYDGKVFSPEAKVEFDVSKREFLTLDNVSLLGIVAVAILALACCAVVLAKIRRRPPDIDKMVEK
jgi:hypothetical protein